MDRPKRLDEILRTDDLFGVDLIACSLAAEKIRDCRWESESGPTFRSEPELVVLLGACAISHQINWDFLTGALRLSIQQTDDPARHLATITSHDVATILQVYPKKDRIRSRERAALLREVGRGLLNDFGGRAEYLIMAAGRRLRGAEGLLARLDTIAPFRQDPLRKKSNVFVHELVRSRMASFVDEDTIDPAIDYHIMRAYLRTGRVVPKHSSLVDVLHGQLPTRGRLVRSLRLSVAEALRTTAYYAHLPIPDVNYIEWHLGRAVCLPDAPRCTTSTVAEDAVLARLTHDGCPFAQSCLASRTGSWLLQEPNYSGSFY